MTETWQERSVKEREWNQTPLGKAFRKFENAHSRFWQMDGQDRISDRKDGREACVAGNPRQCEYPHARND